MNAHMIERQFAKIGRGLWFATMFDETSRPLSASTLATTWKVSSSTSR